MFAKDLGKIVSQIIDSKNDNPNVDTSSLENNLDKLVYKIYDLTVAEIKIIEIGLFIKLTIQPVID